MSLEAKPIRVVLADDHAMVREGMRSLLRGAGWEVVGEASTGHEAIERVRELRPDILLLDVRMPDMDGLAALGVIKQEFPSTAVLMVTTYEDSTYLVRAIAGGAAGYLLKGIGREDLRTAIQRVAAGESVIDPAMLRTVVDRVTQEVNGRASLDVPLTDREIEVLRLVAKGYTNPQIGEELYISGGTARVHVHNILTKISLSDRTQAAVWAAKRGLLPSA